MNSKPQTKQRTWRQAAESLAPSATFSALVCVVCVLCGLLLFRVDVGVCRTSSPDLYSSCQPSHPVLQFSNQDEVEDPENETGRAQRGPFRFREGREARRRGPPGG